MLGVAVVAWFYPEARMVPIGFEAAARVVATDPDVQRAAWTLVLAVLGGVVTVATSATVLWKVARPHVDGYVRRIVAPVAQSVREVRDEVRPQTGHSLSDSAAAAVTAAANVDRKLDHLAHVLRRVGGKADQNTRRLDSLDERADTIGTLLEEHVEEARGMVNALEEQGLSLPRRGDSLRKDDET